MFKWRKLLKVERVRGDWELGKEGRISCSRMETAFRGVKKKKKWRGGEQ